MRNSEWIEMDDRHPPQGAVVLFCNQYSDDVRGLYFVGWLVDNTIYNYESTLRASDRATHWAHIQSPDFQWTAPPPQPQG